MSKVRFIKSVLCLSVLAAFGGTAYWHESGVKPQHSIVGTQRHVDILNIAPFVDVRTKAEILGAASALLVLADGRVSEPELAFMRDIIKGAALTTGQGEYDVTSDVLAGMDPLDWMLSFERYLEAGKIAIDQTTAFTSADYITYQELLSKRIKQLDKPADSFLILLAMAKTWSTKAFIDGTPEQIAMANLERDKVVFYFRTLRKSYKNYPRQATIQQPVAIAITEPEEEISK